MTETGRDPRLSSNGDDSWLACRRLVLTELERLDRLLRSVIDKQVDQSVQIATLTVKAGVWGALAGLLPVVLYLVFALVTKTVGR